MASYIRHNFQSAVADNPADLASGNLTPSRWNADHDLALDAADVTITPISGLTATNVQAALEELMPPTYATQYDDTGTGTAYVGEAAPGTAAGAATWRIKLLTFSGDDVSVTWASGNSNFDKTWTARASYSYS